MNFFTKHLKDVGETYFEHAKNAAYFGINLFYASIAVFIHALLPFVFLTTGSKTVKKLYNMMTARAEIASLSSKAKTKIVIIGFGASGLSCLLELVKNFNKKNHELVIDIFEKNFSSAKGLAYSTKNFSHILNVDAGKMSIEIDDKDSFINWLKNNNYSFESSDFVPRVLYGLYLEDMTSKALKIAGEKGIKCRFVNLEVENLEVHNKLFVINNQAYHHLILASGINLKNIQNNSWNCNLDQYLNDPEIYIAGAGLTAFDTIVSLIDKKYQGKIFAYSRSGFVTKERTAYNQKSNPPLCLEDVNLPLSEIFHKFVKACKNSEQWQAIIDSMRPITQEFWIKLSLDKKKRFIRHCLKYWSVYRHRCPEKQFEKIRQLVAQNKLVFVKGKIENKKFIDCTGLDFRAASVLMDNMTKSKLILKDDLDMGIVANVGNLYVIGALNFGSLLETTAIPDITKQAAEIGKKIYK